MAGDGLDRSLGLAAMTANAVNCIVASGIFVLPAVVAAIIGPAWLVAYLICAVAIALVFLCLAEAASRVSETGGTYRYVEVAFGPFAGVLLGVVLWFSGVASSAAVADIFAGTLGAVVPMFNDGIGRAALLITTYAILTAINIRGVKAGAIVVETVTILKIAPLALLIVGGLFALHVQHATVAVSANAPTHSLGRATLELFFAFTGIEVALTPAGEVTNPARTMPRAVLLALVVVTALYIGSHYVAQGILGGAALAADQTAPLASTAARVFGPFGRGLMLAAAALSTFAYVSGDILASPRIMFALGREGYLPSILGSVHARHRTPYIAIPVYATIACGMALTGTFRVLAALGAIAALIIYLASCLAMIVLRRRHVETDGKPFIAPGGPIVPALGCLLIVWLLAQSNRAEVITMSAVLALGTVLYAVTKLSSMRRSAPDSSA
jgi:basic amino acid/polyamine antiporter, APA family